MSHSGGSKTASRRGIGACLVGLILLVSGSAEAGPGTSWRDVMARSVAFEESGHHREAIESFEELLRLIDEGRAPAGRNLPYSLRALARLHRRLGRTSEEIAVRERYDRYLSAAGDVVERRVNQVALGKAFMARAEFAKARAILRGVLESKDSPRWNPLRRIEGLLAVAECESHRANGDGADTDAASAAYREAHSLAEQLFAKAGGSLSLRERQECRTGQARALIGLGREDEAADLYRTIAADYRDAKLSGRARATLVALFELQMERQRHEEAEKTLREAMTTGAYRGARGQLAAAHLELKLASLYRETSRLDQAGQARERAAKRLRHVVDHPENASGGERDRAFQALRQLYLQERQYSEAAQLLEARLDEGMADESERLALHRSLAALCGRLQRYEDAASHLRKALSLVPNGATTERLGILGRLAVIEQSRGDVEEAERLVSKVVELAEEGMGVSDLDRAETFHGLANLAAGRGAYLEAIPLYRRAIASSIAAGEAGLDQQAASQRDVGRAFRAQGRYEKAHQHLSKSFALTKERYGADSPKLIPSLTALASLHVSRGELSEAWTTARAAAALLERAGADDASEVAALNDLSATICRRCGDTDRAEEHWEAARTALADDRPSALYRRTLNNLARLAADRGDVERSESLYREALDLHTAMAGAYPALGFISGSGLAESLRRQGRRDEARRMLEEAVSLLEQPRAHVTGGRIGQVNFLAPCASAFDMLVDLHLEEGNIASAFHYAERARNRTYLDQLDLAGVDADGSSDAALERLLEREEMLRQRVHRIRGEVGDLVSLEALDEEVERAREDLAAAERAFADARKDVVDARRREKAEQSSLPGSAPTEELPRLRSIDNGSVVLFYHLGGERSHLLVWGAGLASPKSYDLSLSHEQAERLNELLSHSRRPRTKNPNQTRAPVGTVLSKPGDLITAVPGHPLVTEGPLTRQEAAVLVTGYLAALLEHRQGTRAPVDVAWAPMGVPRKERLAVVTEILLPEEARREVERLSPKRLTVVPDGALHQLPFEALMIKEGDSPEYLLHRWPPIHYAPSAAILAKLEERATTIVRNPSVLSVGNPTYTSKPVDLADATTTVPLIRDAYLELGGVLPALPASAEECRRVARAFPADSVRRLEGDQATEGNVVAALEGKHYVHVAAHGLVDERHENLFGALALTPPSEGQRSPDDDGFLSLHEIHQLPLSACELAVLSACRTNAGPERPLEAGSSLARAFLAAGARRVIASHWNVADESSAALVGAFFEELARAHAEGGTVDYAEALHQARRKISRDPRWSDPFHWAPFVLVGPATARPEPASR
ncbi:photosystem I assembly protein Ycf3 [Planctomycetes bacterium Pan216]|uniref:Photosystem I assembly protein Ycf3 n=1 Tax=Kolteria novifilia TaxID=2527975 RepID=A0A518B661_9BACT|nr:photosystem I assembly protein Ycf3 [Planctomycetes bacterium Pan216]